jgi:hypothetical protein
MKDSRCKICADADAIVAVAELRAKGASVRDISHRLSRPKSSIARHILHALAGKKPNCAATSLTGSEKRRVSHAGRKAGRIADRRCRTCGLLAEDADPKQLVTRAERLLWLAEQIAAQAQKDDDARLALQAVDRARSSLEMLLRVHGLWQPDAVQDNRTVNVFASRSREDLERILDGLQRLPALESAPPGVH